MTIEDERAPSWNGMYAGVHWSKRAKLAREIHLKVRAALAKGIEPFDVPVDILLVAYYRKSAPDSDNIVAKPYIDGLKGHVLHDDDARWVRRAATEAVLAKENKVEIIITPVG